MVRYGSTRTLRYVAVSYATLRECETGITSTEVQQAVSVTDRGRLHSSQVTVNTAHTVHNTQLHIQYNVVVRPSVVCNVPAPYSGN